MRRPQCSSHLDFDDDEMIGAGAGSGACPCLTVAFHGESPGCPSMPDSTSWNPE